MQTTDGAAEDNVEGDVELAPMHGPTQKRQKIVLIVSAKRMPTDSGGGVASASAARLQELYMGRVARACGAGGLRHGAHLSRDGACTGQRQRHAKDSMFAAYCTLKVLANASARPSCSRIRSASGARPIVAYANSVFAKVCAMNMPAIASAPRSRCPEYLSPGPAGNAGWKAGSGLPPSRASYYSEPVVQGFECPGAQTPPTPTVFVPRTRRARRLCRSQ